MTGFQFPGNINLMDEARRHGIAVAPARLEREIGVPVVAGAARSSTGIDALLDAAHGVATGRTRTRPFRLTQQAPPGSNRRSRRSPRRWNRRSRACRAAAGWRSA